MTEMTEGSRPTKYCPDCAEEVLAAARKCRYCGYRFDEPQAPPPSDALHGLMGFIRRPARPPSTAAVLRQMGVQLHEGERLSGMWFGEVSGSYGYVIVTSERFLFVESPAAPGRSRPLHERRLAEMVSAEPAGRRWERGLVVEWQGASPVVIRNVAAKGLAQLHSALLAHRPSA